MASYQLLYFEEGSAVRQLSSGILQTREEYERERQKRKDKQKQKRIYEHRLTKLRSRRATALFALGAVLTGGFFVSYVDVQNRITTSMTNISKLEKQVSELKAENASAENRISMAANLSDIQKTATEDLGMVYASSGQIVYYNADEEDYMNQYVAVR